MQKTHFKYNFAKYSFIELPEKPPHASVKTFLRYRSFCEIDPFQLGVFSIRNFILRNLKGNGNAPLFMTAISDGSNVCTPLNHIFIALLLGRGG